MDSTFVTLTTFMAICIGAGCGFGLKKHLREDHLNSATQDAVKLATGVVATLTAMVLGLLVASAKQSFDARANQVHSFVVNLTLLDRTMRQYTPALGTERRQLAAFAKAIRGQLWGTAPNVNGDVLTQLEVLRSRFRDLDPQSTRDKLFQDRFMTLSGEMILAGSELLESHGSSVGPHIVAIVDVWLMIIFLGFGLFAPRNRVSVSAMVVSAGAVAMALFMIVEMDTPFDGFVSISPALIDQAIGELST